MKHKPRMKKDEGLRLMSAWKGETTFSIGIE